MVISKEFLENLIDEKASLVNDFLFNSTKGSIEVQRKHFNKFQEQISKDIQVLPFSQFIQKILKLQREQNADERDQRMEEFVKVVEKLAKLKAERN